MSDRGDRNMHLANVERSQAPRRRANEYKTIGKSTEEYPFSLVRVSIKLFAQYFPYSNSLYDTFTAAKQRDIDEPTLGDLRHSAQP
jgi:hypothetical protein